MGIAVACFVASVIVTVGCTVKAMQFAADGSASRDGGLVTMVTYSVATGVGMWTMLVSAAVIMRALAGS